MEQNECGHLIVGVDIGMTYTGICLVSTGNVVGNPNLEVRQESPIRGTIAPRGSYRNGKANTQEKSIAKSQLFSPTRVET
jgi:hypothetical protein